MDFSMDRLIEGSPGDDKMEETHLEETGNEEDYLRRAGDDGMFYTVYWLRGKDPELEKGERYYTHKEPKPNSRVDQYGYDRIIHETERYGNVYGDIELSEVEDYLGPGQLIEVYRAKTGETYRKYAWLGENGEKIEITFHRHFQSEHWDSCDIVSNMAPEASEEPKPVANPNVRAVEKAYLAKMKEHGYDYEPLEEIEATENFVEETAFTGTRWTTFPMMNSNWSRANLKCSFY